MAFSTSGWRMSRGTIAPRTARLDLERHSQPLAVAGLLDLRVPAEQRQLLRQRGLHPGAAPQREPQHLAQAREQPFGARRVLPDQGRDRVQGVEQEVRLELRAQHVQPRLGELAGVGGGGDTAPARLPGVGEGLGRGDDLQ